MHSIDARIRVDSDDERRAVANWLRAHVPLGELVEQGDDVSLRCDTDDENAAVVRTQQLLNRACHFSGVERSHVHRVFGHRS
jgi:phosphotransferase system HPr-like phosphotransfer protein